ncbi:hypothetical protein Bca101_062788 [Brassica carinata]
MQGVLWLITFLLVFSSAYSTQVLLPPPIRSPKFNEKISTPGSISPPARHCFRQTLQQLDPRPCKRTPPKGSGG